MQRNNNYKRDITVIALLYLITIVSSFYLLKG